MTLAADLASSKAAQVEAMTDAQLDVAINASAAASRRERVEPSQVIEIMLSDLKDIPLRRAVAALGFSSVEEMCEHNVRLRRLRPPVVLTPQGWDMSTPVAIILAVPKSEKAVQEWWDSSDDETEVNSAVNTRPPSVL